MGNGPAAGRNLIPKPKNKGLKEGGTIRARRGTGDKEGQTQPVCRRPGKTTKGREGKKVFKPKGGSKAASDWLRKLPKPGWSIRHIQPCRTEDRARVKSKRDLDGSGLLDNGEEQAGARSAFQEGSERDAGVKTMDETQVVATKGPGPKGLNVGPALEDVDVGGIPPSPGALDMPGMRHHEVI